MSSQSSTNGFVPKPLLKSATFQDPCWNDRNLLSLDGGGVRGYWSLLVLEKLMEMIGEEERRQAEAKNEDVSNLHSFLPMPLPQNHTLCPQPPAGQHVPREFYAQRFLPCHYFDLICGSSTGSLIAIMLCRFRMTVKDCLQEYERMSHTIFGNPRWVSQRNIFIVPWPKYSAKAMEQAFKEVTERRGERPQTERDVSPPSTFKTRHGTCSMFATTLRRKESKEVDTQTFYLLRSYIHKERKHIPRRPWKINFTSEGDMEIWRIARAATAAPFYFRELKVKSDSNEKIYYSDGGFGHTNNPTQEGIRELETLHRRLEGNEVVYGSIGVIVSIGTARADGKPGGRSAFKRTKEAYNIATNPKHVAEAVQYDDRPNCWRFNDEQGLDMELDDWKPNKFASNPGHKSIDLMRNGFNNWLVSDWKNIEMLEACARELVTQRRRRTGNSSKWERFATAVEFYCLSGECHNSSFKSRDDYTAHFDSTHANQQDQEFYRTPDAKPWTYPGPHLILVTPPNTSPFQQPWRNTPATLHLWDSRDMPKRSLLLLHTPRWSPVPNPPGLEALMRILHSIPRLYEHATHVLIDGLVKFWTLPYYRLYQFNTIQPIKKIAAFASEPLQDSTKIAQALATWRQRKLAELQFITIACTVLAAAVIGSFSWTTIEEAHWLTHGFWHSSLIFSILGILLCASEVTVLHLLGPVDTRPKYHERSAFEKYKALLLSPSNDSRTPGFVPRKKMVFTWQGPLMFMSYSVCAFLAGLTVLVCSPLIQGGPGWTAGHSIAVVYLTAFAGAGTAFVFCSFWVYHYVELEFDSDEREAGGPSPSPTDSLGYGNMFGMSVEGGPSINNPRIQEWRAHRTFGRHGTT
ncbi:hypothetical protein OPT61_g3396 [Boeremia exigua]|uniref:Uncharacterized protein n=1 Tax=Boeremia exigua TaxID=749465 RepID=A0ACC2II27_9PLEO|nr:hypothetical protein OPT61_g3396 [Boeremia exigua]